MGKGMQPAEFKSTQFGVVELSGDGIVEGFSAVTGNLDRDQERFVAGAFVKTVAERKAKIPMGCDHAHGFGVTLDMEEVGRADLPPLVLKAAPDATGGLWCRGQVMPTTDNVLRFETLQQRRKAGRDVTMSITFRPVLEQKAKTPRGEVREIVEARVEEWGPALMLQERNPAALVTEMKAGSAGLDDAETKARMPGSFEELSATISDAIRRDEVLGKDTDFYIQGTYPDSVVVRVYNGDGAGHYRISYGMVDGSIQLGSPSPVVLQTVVVDVAHKATYDELTALQKVAYYTAELKAGRALSGLNLADLDAALELLQKIRARAQKDTGDSAGTGTEGDGAKPSAKPTAAKATDDPAVRARALELDLGLLQTEASMLAIGG